MSRARWRPQPGSFQFIYLVPALLLCASASAWAQPQQVRVEPEHNSGQSVTGAFEGWFANSDGTFSLLLGYLNRNATQELDIPVGADNKIEPGGPDQGQPTHFLPHRRWGIFTVTVPKDFGSKKLTWTLTANGVTTVIPASLNSLYELSPFKDATGNTPPSVGFSEKGPFVNGPRGISKTLKAMVGVPLPLHVWVADDASIIPGDRPPSTPAVTLTWGKFRGPGTVTFSDSRPLVLPSEFVAPLNTKFRGEASTEASFSEPGEYVLHLAANDWSGEGGQGFQCCWTNAEMKISVSAAR
jgi:hypothetical protein